MVDGFESSQRKALLTAIANTDEIKTKILNFLEKNKFSKGRLLSGHPIDEKLNAKCYELAKELLGNYQFFKNNSDYYSDMGFLIKYGEYVAIPTARVFNFNYQDQHEVGFSNGMEQGPLKTFDVFTVRSWLDDDYDFAYCKKASQGNLRPNKIEGVKSSQYIAIDPKYKGGDFEIFNFTKRDNITQFDIMMFGIISNRNSKETSSADFDILFDGISQNVKGSKGSSFEVELSTLSLIDAPACFSVTIHGTLSATKKEKLIRELNALYKQISCSNLKKLHIYMSDIFSLCVLSEGYSKLLKANKLNVIQKSLRCVMSELSRGYSSGRCASIRDRHRHFLEQINKILEK